MKTYKKTYKEEQYFLKTKMKQCFLRGFQHSKYNINLHFEDTNNTYFNLFKEINETIEEYVDEIYNIKMQLRQYNGKTAPLHREDLKKEMLKVTGSKYGHWAPYKNMWSKVMGILKRLERYRQIETNVANRKYEPYFDSYKTASMRCKFNTNYKDNMLDALYNIYIKELKYRYNQIKSGKLINSRGLSSKLIPNYILKSARWKQLCYKHACDLAKQTKHGDISKEQLILDERFINLCDGESKEFRFIEIMTPFLKDGYKKRFKRIRIPFKFNKYTKNLEKKDFIMKNCLKIYKRKNDFYIGFTYFKNESLFNAIKTYVEKFKNKVGINIEYNRLLTTSYSNDYRVYDNNNELSRIYKKIGKKKKGSKAFKRALIERDNLVKHIIKQIPFHKFGKVIIDNYRWHTSYREYGFDKFSRWNSSYDKYMEGLCKDNGAIFTKVRPYLERRRLECPFCGFEHSYDTRKFRFSNYHRCPECDEYIFINNSLADLNQEAKKDEKFIASSFQSSYSKISYSMFDRELYKISNSHLRMLISFIQWLFNNKSPMTTRKILNNYILNKKYKDNNYFKNSIIQFISKKRK